MSETQEKLPEGMLDAPEFAAFFSGDQEPVRIEFKVAGQDASVTLRAMDSGALDRYRLTGVKTKLTQDDDGKQRMEIEEIDQGKRSLYLVSHSLVGWEIPTRKKLTGGRLGDWEVLPASERESQRLEFIEKNFRCVPEAWAWLVQKCLEINGLTEGAQKN